MADPVLIEFGAKIDKLTEGVNQVKEQLSEVKRHAESFGEGVGKLGDVIKTAFSVEAIRRFIETISEVGHTTERFSLMLGLSTERVAELSGVAVLTGTTLESLTNGIERISLNVQRAAKDGFDPAAQALKVLGLNAKDLIGVPTDRYLEKIADAFSKLEPSLNRTNALWLLGGRGISTLIPVLDQGSAGFKKFHDDILATGTLLSGPQINALRESNEQVHLLGISVLGLGEALFLSLKGPIDSVVGSLKDMVQWFTKASSEGGALSGTMWMLGQITKIAAAVLAALTGTVQELALVGEAAVTFFSAGSREKFAQISKDMEAVAKATLERVKAIYATGDRIVVPLGHNTRPPASPLNLGAGAEADAARARLEGQRAVNAEWLKQQQQLLGSEVNLGIISAGRKLAIERDYVAAAFQAELGLLEQERTLYAGKPAMQARISAEIERLQATHATKMQQLVLQEVEAYAQKWKDALTTIQSSWDGQLRGVLAGTTSLAQAAKTVLGDLVIASIQYFERMGIQWAATQLGMVTVSQTSAAAQAAAAVAGSEATLPVRIARFTTDITANAGAVFAGVFANLAPFLGPAAAGPAGVAQAAVLAELVNVPKFEFGTDYVPNTGLALVHEGERITPASQNRRGGGDTNIHLHATFMDGPSINRWLRNGGARQIADAMG